MHMQKKTKLSNHHRNFHIGLRSIFGRILKFICCFPEVNMACKIFFSALLAHLARLRHAHSEQVFLPVENASRFLKIHVNKFQLQIS